MAARGSIAKEQIINQILETFSGSFKYDKEIRIPVMENGEEVQIKVTLTAAKVNVEHGADEALPGAMTAPVSAVNQPPAKPEYIAPTQEEKDNIANLLKTLNL